METKTSLSMALYGAFPHSLKQQTKLTNAIAMHSRFKYAAVNPHPSSKILTGIA
jgi:hypothetical protein